MQLLLTLLFCAAFALCLLLKLTWVLRAVGYPFMLFLAYLMISTARGRRQLRTVPPQSWVAIPILTAVLILRLRHLAQAPNLELSLCAIAMNLVFLASFSIMYWPAGTPSSREPQLTKKQRNKARKQKHRNRD